MPRGITAIVEEQTKEEETHTKAKATACSRGGGAVATTGAVRATCDYLRASSRDDLHTSRTTRHLCTSRTTRTVRQRWLCCLRPFLHLEAQPRGCGRFQRAGCYFLT